MSDDGDRDGVPTARGRPPLEIPWNQIRGLRDLGFTWRTVSNMIGINERTIRNRRPESDSNLLYSTMTDDEVDEVLKTILEMAPNSGETMVLGALRAQGVRLQRERVRASLTRLDPIGRDMRRRSVIYRRRYKVPSPNYIWHIDGQHKLIEPWGFVIHGGVDGFSRTTVYLHCATNNRASTVFENFLKAVDIYGRPQKVRSDYGTENVEVARFMIGQQSGSMITGQSVHNQRIERLWRDVGECVTSVFRQIFATMEEESLADRYDPVHVFAMRYVFTPRINRALETFQAQWNDHPLRTEGNRSPNMLWTEGMLLLGADEESEICLFDDDDVVPEIQTNNDVQVPQPDLELEDALMTRLEREVNPLDDSDGSHGVFLFAKTVRLMREFGLENIREAIVVMDNREES